MTLYAVHQASTLCGENETELYSNPTDAGVRYAELVSAYKDNGDDLEIYEDTETSFYVDNESAGTYNRISVEPLTIVY